MALYFWCDNLENDELWKWKVKLVTFGEFFLLHFSPNWAILSILSYTYFFGENDKLENDKF